MHTGRSDVDGVDIGTATGGISDSGGMDFSESGICGWYCADAIGGVHGVSYSTFSALYQHVLFVGNFDCFAFGAKGWKGNKDAVSDFSGNGFFNVENMGRIKCEKV